MISRLGLAALALGAFAAGCAFVPKPNSRLDAAIAAQREAEADPQVARHAGAELRAAAEYVEKARVARDTLDDPAVVDHLAYVARQRVAIAREAARLRAINN
jgi:hypothetical protein